MYLAEQWLSHTHRLPPSPARTAVLCQARQRPAALLSWAWCLCAGILFTEVTSAQAFSEYRSQHLRVYSDGPAFSAETLITRLEALHTLVLSHTGDSELPSGTELTVYLLHSPTEHKRLRPAAAASNVFLLTHAQALLVTSPEQNDEQLEHSYHQYIHYLLANTGRQYPHWYAEGMALMLSSVDFFGPFIRIGAVPRVLISR